ncbi:riboflavin synthase domain-like protein [Suillus decipiens]|nr:riboflavin synthase domain-like protein [Suillus decipiens]
MSTHGDRENAGDNQYSFAPRELLILYATETDTAEETADRIARECRRVRFHCRVQSMNTYDLPDELFEDMDFCVFGLGDTAYEKFCWPAKKLSRKVQNLGGHEICSRGEGDEQHRLGIDSVLNPWIECLLEQDNVPAGRPPPRVSLSNLASGALLDPDPLDEDTKFHTASVKFNRRINAEDWFQDERHFEFSFEDDIKYNPGDVVVIHPCAVASEVDSFLVTMGWANVADDFFTIEHTMLDQTLPDHLPKILECEKLDDFVSTEGADELYDYCQHVKRTTWEVLSEFRSARIPRFSIASSIELHPREIYLCIAIVRYRMKLKIHRKGVCTSYLSRLKSGDTFPIGLRKGFVSLPTHLNTPVVCVGPGTGIGPMRAVIEQRMHEGHTNTTLYFGCRSAHKDQHYHSEWESHAEERKLRYHAACSCDGSEGIKRTDTQYIWTMLGQQRGILNSGSSNKMLAAVREVVRGAYIATMEREG